MAAASAVSAALNSDVVKTGLSGGVKGRLGTIQFCCVGEQSGTFVVVYLLRWRAEGFLVLMPSLDAVRNSVDEIALTAGEAAFLDLLEVAMETARGRQLGTAEVIIADFPWSWLSSFRRCPTTRGSGNGTVTLFQVGSTVGRPVEASALSGAQQWITDTLDGDTAQEYTDAVEDLDSGPVPESPALSRDVASAQAAELSQLRERLSQMEGLLRAQGTMPAPKVQAAPRSMLDASGLDGTEPLQQRTAPKRLGKQEALVPAPTLPTLEEQMLAEVDREVAIEGDHQDSMLTLESRIAQTSDPMQRLLLLQMRQTSDLLKTLAPKTPSDPLVALLGGQDSGSGGSSSGSINVKGYAAREAYLKQLEDDRLVVQTIRLNARRELGISESKEEPSMLRSYLENRIPVGDHRTLAQIGYMLAAGWESASERSNLQMMAFCGRRMTYVEQACLDGGRTNLALAFDWTDGTKLSAAFCDKEAHQPDAIRQTAGSIMGSSQRLLSEGHRHVRDQVETDRIDSPQPDSKRRIDRGKSESKEPTQKAKRRERGDRPGRLLGFDCSGVPGVPEQRSSRPNITRECHPPPDKFSKHKSFAPPDSLLDSHELIDECLSLLERTPSAFNRFRFLSLAPNRSLRTSKRSAAQNALWPVPPPLWRWTGTNSPNPKNRRRRRKIRAQVKLLQHVVCMLNWITLGYPDKPPKVAQAGEPWTHDQYKALETLERHISHFCHLKRFAQNDLGRFGEKFAALRQTAEELPSHLEVDLQIILHDIQATLDGYTKFEQPHFVARVDHEVQHSDCHHDPEHVSMPNTTNKPVVADRIKWKHPARFNPKPYLLDPVVSAVFDNPDTLRIPQHLWPSKRKARVQCSRPDLLKLMKIWDAHDALALFPCEEVDDHETVGIFAVPKDSQFDRLIINPTVINSRMSQYSNYTKGLAPGSLLSLLSLDADQSFRFCADDLSDFYYTFRVPRNRAKRNCIGLKVYPSEVQNLKCFESGSVGPFYPALATLAMGDSHAVEIAQGSHHALLQLEAGSMLPSETLEYRKPIPRGNFVELLAIDDHIGVESFHKRFALELA